MSGNSFKRATPREVSPVAGLRFDQALQTRREGSAAGSPGGSPAPGRRY